jgi:hypothetical protein
MSRFSLVRSAPAPTPAAPAAPPPVAPPAARVESKPKSPARDAGLDLRLRLHAKLIEELDLAKLDKLDEAELRRQVLGQVTEFARIERMALNARELEALGASIYDEMVGLGPIEPLLKDDSINDILINGPYQVYIERRGELELTPIRFRDNDHLLRIVNRIVAAVGRRIDESQPMVDARLPDGSRVNAAIPPVAIDGCSVSIRKFSKKPLTLEKLVEFGAMTHSMSDFLRGRPEPGFDRDFRRHRVGQDHPAKRSLLGDQRGRAPDHHRGRGRVAAATAARRAYGNPPAQHRGQGRDPSARAGQERPADATRPGDPGRGAVGRSLRHASGHEYRPRRLDGDDPLQQSARSHQPS